MKILIKNVLFAGFFLLPFLNLNAQKKLKDSVQVLNNEMDSLKIKLAEARRE